MKPSQCFVSFDPLKSEPISFCQSNNTRSSFQSNVCFLIPCLRFGFLEDVPLGLKCPKINFSLQVIFFSWKAITSKCLNECSWHSTNRHCVPLKEKKIPSGRCASAPSGEKIVSPYISLGETGKDPPEELKGDLGGRGERVQVLKISVHKEFHVSGACLRFSQAQLKMEGAKYVSSTAQNLVFLWWFLS